MFVNNLVGNRDNNYFIISHVKSTWEKKNGAELREIKSSACGRVDFTCLLVQFIPNESQR